MEVKDEPQVIGTSRDIAQGAVDLMGTRWDAEKNSLEGASLVTGNDPYEIRLATQKSFSVWKCAKAVVSNNDQKAGVKIRIVEQNGWKLRVQTDAPQNRKVQWKLLFE